MQFCNTEVRKESHFVKGYIGDILKRLWEETEGKETYDQNQRLCVLGFLKRGVVSWLVWFGFFLPPFFFFFFLAERA